MQAFVAAKVAVFDTAFSFDAEYTYHVISEFVRDIKPGARVLVPFGKGNRRRIGFVTKIYEKDMPDPALKPIFALIDKEPLINEELLSLIFWLRDNTFCTLFEAFKTIVPTGFSVSYKPKYSLVNTDADCELTDEEKNFLRFARSVSAGKELDEVFDCSADKKKQSVVNSLIEKGLVEEIKDFKRQVGDETVRMLRLSDEFLNGEIVKKLTPKQNAVVALLEESETASVKEVCYLANVTPSICSRLVSAGVLSEYSYEVLRTPDFKDGERMSADDYSLSDEQQKAYDGIVSLIERGKPAGALLYGVTGSGKTSVFIKLIDYVTKKGKSAILLVPEISLTPQAVNKFRSLFGDTVAVIHSSLSLGQRVDEYKRIRQGKAKIVIGTRSAVFAPLENIGIIIMDEEGEHTYKSESSPRYHARDVAINRCGNHNCVLLMASATPSLESYYYAKQGRFSLFELEKRYNNAKLPDVVIVDMQQEVLDGNSGLFSRELERAVRENIEKKEQTILLLNRRGFYTYLSCLDCKKPLECPNCGIPLTYHKSNDSLMCHYCGYVSANTNKCPDCGGDHILTSGVGTQRVEDEVARLFPEARVLRMDADTTCSRYAYEKNFSDFGEGKYDIMLGTQMIAKGLDFPNVTLVGVLSLDRALFTGDFRSYERTFSLVTQVVGRGGRGDKKGVAFIQTFVPEHYVLNLAARQDYKEFYEQETALRKALLYPPFCDICVVGFSSSSDEDAYLTAEAFVKLMKNEIAQREYKMPLRVLGPAKCILGRINNRYRYRIIIKFKNNRAFREMMAELLKKAVKLPKGSNVRIYADINGDIGL